MLKTESPCFKPKETVGEVPSSRLVHNIQQCQKEVILFSQTPLLNIPELLSHTEFNQIHPLKVSLFLPKISNLPRAGRLKEFLRNWKKLTKNPAILEIAQRWNTPFISYPKQSKAQRVITVSNEETKLVDQ